MKIGYFGDLLNRAGGDGLATQCRGVVKTRKIGGLRMRKNPSRRCPKGRRFSQRRATPWFIGRFSRRSCHLDVRPNGPTVLPQLWPENGWPVGPRSDEDGRNGDHGRFTRAACRRVAATRPAHATVSDGGRTRAEKRHPIGCAPPKIAASSNASVAAQFSAWRPYRASRMPLLCSCRKRAATRPSRAKAITPRGARHIRFCNSGNGRSSASSAGMFTRHRLH